MAKCTTKTIEQTNLVKLVEKACRLKSQISNLTKQVEELNKEISPFLSIGQMVPTELGAVSMCKGRMNTKWLISDEEKKHIQTQQREDLLSRSLIVEVEGDPYLQYDLPKG